MTTTEKIEELLHYKEHLDKNEHDPKRTSGYDEWIVDVLELLLRCEFDRTKKK